MPATYASYAAGRRGTGPYPGNAQKLVEDAVRLAEAQDPTLDWREFDNDGPDGIPGSGDDDGQVDGLIVVHAGSGYEETGNPNDIHSHFWNVVDEALIVDGVRVFQYNITPEDGRCGVFSHEFGHNLGLPDLYDTDGASSVVGVWSIMSFGAWLTANGTPFGPGAGTRPAHFDAWSKVTLGFALPIAPSDNRPGQVLRPVETVPDIVRLWTNGATTHQYFLVENRAPRGFDTGLPFASDVIGGLLVWHVDEDVATNDDPSHPLLALEQADALRDLEQSPSRNYGDPGDPYALGGAFGLDTTPSSTDYAGQDTQVRIDNVRLQPQGVYTADLTVERAPAVRKLRITLRDGEAGNGDGGLDATERAEAEIEVRNIGLAARGLRVKLESTDPRVVVAGEEVRVGDLDANASAVLPRTFTLTVGDLPRDPYPVTLVLRYTADGYGDTEQVLLTAGDVIGFKSDLEEGEEGFVHSPGRPGYRDDWHLEAGSGRGGSTGWRSAPAGADTYADLTDARLDTPVMALDGATHLFFWHTIEAEVDVGTRAWDGGLIELSLDGGPFEPIAPVEPYPYRIIRNSASPIAERGAFSGTIAEFEQVEFDLSGKTGAARLRFHFGSDGSITRRGWVIDDVTVVSPAEPYAVTFLAPGVNAAGQVVVSFEVEEFFPGVPYGGRGFMVYRQAVSPGFPLKAVKAGGVGGGRGGRLLGVPPGFEPVTEVPLQPPALTVIDSAGVRPGEIFAYLVEDLRQEGEEPRLYGPRRVLVPVAAAGPRLVRSNPNPFGRGSGEATVVQFLVPPGPGAGAAGDVLVRLGVYDVAGRRVAELVDGLRPPGKNEARWDGRTVRGFAAPSGVYYLRLEAGGRSDALGLVVLR